MPTLYLDILFALWLSWMIYDKALFPKTLGFQRKSLKAFRKQLFSLHRANWDVYPERTNTLLLDLIAECDEKQQEEIQDKATLKAYIKEKDELVKKALPRQNNVKLAENVDAFMVTFAIAFAIRAVVFQPFKIPTGSMQPTLFGITANDSSANVPDKDYVRSPSVQPKGIRSLLDGIYYGRSYYDFEVQSGNMLRGIQKLRPKDVLGKANGIPYLSTYSLAYFDDNEVLFPGTSREVVSALGSFKDFTQFPVQTADGEESSAYVANKDLKFKGHVQSGDFLFVNRMTYHFKEPARGDITVFDTSWLDGPKKNGLRAKDARSMAGMFYIKRLIGLPGDTIRVLKNGQLEVKEKGSEVFVNLSEFIPEFTKKMYSNKGGYAGYDMAGEADKMTDDYFEYNVADGHYFMLGDNSYNSRDSRMFGAIRRRDLIGTALGVFWPFSRHWGLVDGVDPVDVKTYSNGDI